MLVSMSKIKKDAQFQVAHVDKSSRPMSQKKFREVAIGGYKVSRFRPKLRSTTTVEIEVYGSVLADAKTEFSKRLEKNWDGSARTS